MSKKHFFRNTFLLTSAGLISRILGFFYRIFLSHTIGAKGVGLYQLVVPLQHLVLAMSTSGIQISLSRLVSSHTALGETKEARDIFRIGMFLAVCLSGSISWILFTFSDFFAVQILKEPSTNSLIRLLALSFPFASVHNCINGYYLGLKKASFPAALQVMEQLVRIGSSFLIYHICLSNHISVTAMIAVAGSFLSELAVALCSFIVISLNFSGTHLHIEKPLQKISEISQMALPMTLNRLLLSVLAAIEVVLIPQRLRMYGLSHTASLSLYGIFSGMALPCILFPSTITNSASVMLMPSVAEMQALGYRKRIRYITRNACTGCILLGALCTAGFYFSGSFIGNVLFHNDGAGLYIRTLSFICPFLYTNIALTSILNGLGKTGLTLIHSTLGILLRISFVLFAIPVIGIRGYLYGLLLSEIFVSLLHIYALYRIQL